MKYIALTGKKGHGKFAIVDDEDYEYFSQWKWNIYGEYVARHTHQSINGIRTDKVHLMHRIVNNTPEGFDTDHKNRNKLDNRKSNLRTCTRGQNRANTSMGKNNTTGYRGVIRVPAIAHPYHAQIRCNDNNISLGSYATPQEAAIAYDCAAIQLHGEFATLNIL